MASTRPTAPMRPPRRARSAPDESSRRLRLAAALREKLLCGDLKLDDVELELLKMAIVRGSQDSPIGDDNELRLVGARGSELSLAWIVAASERSIATLDVPRSTYDEISADHGDWQAIREEIASEPFVDMNRLLLTD